MQGPNLLSFMVNLQLLVIFMVTISESDSAILPQNYARRKQNHVGPEGRLSIADWDSYNLQEPEGPGTYAFGYDIDDAKSGNTQFREEERHPDGSVTGSYGYIEPDGNVHIVYYVADDKGYRVRIEDSRNKSLQKDSLRQTFKISNNEHKIIKNPFIVSVKNPQPFNAVSENKFYHSTSPPVAIHRPSPIQNIHIPLYQPYSKPSIEIAPPYQINYGTKIDSDQKRYHDQQIQAQYVGPLQQKVITSKYNNYSSPAVYSNTPNIYQTYPDINKRKNNNALSYNMYFVPNTQYLNLIK